MSNIFEKRTHFKPFEYPQLLTWIDMIHKTFWVHDEIDFTADVNDYMINLKPNEKEVFKRSLLAIAQIEIGVKLFWGSLYNYLPKPEINGLGSTFAHTEWIHSQAYSNLLTILGLEQEFLTIYNIPALVKKQKFNEEKLSSDDIVDKMFYFIIGIENTSLFSQFGNIVSLTRFKGLMKNVTNIIGWTSMDEDCHANAGIEILNIIFTENPHIKEKYTQEYVTNLLNEYIKVESENLDWIYEEGELGFFSKEDMLNYMKYRLDNSMVKLGYDKIYNITSDQYLPMKWFEEEIYSNALDDFFAKRPTDYTKHDGNFDTESLFDDED